VGMGVEGGGTVGRGQEGKGG